MAGGRSVSFISAEDLVDLQGAKAVIVDVRDEERSFDGHLAGSLHYASDSFEEKLPDLLQNIKGQDTVVFHCAKSQIRGPTCARMLCNHLNKAVNDGSMEKSPKVVVLERGFNGWASAGRPICSCKDIVCLKK